MFTPAIESLPELGDLVEKAKEVISPIDALRLLRDIPEEDFDLLWLNALVRTPFHTFMQQFGRSARLCVWLYAARQA